VSRLFEQFEVNLPDESQADPHAATGQVLDDLFRPGLHAESLESLFHGLSVARLFLRVLRHFHPLWEAHSLLPGGV
jgi:hypothetical protein